MKDKKTTTKKAVKKLTTKKATRKLSVKDINPKHSTLVLREIRYVPVWKWINFLYGVSVGITIGAVSLLLGMIVGYV